MASGYEVVLGHETSLQALEALGRSEKFFEGPGYEKVDVPVVAGSRPSSSRP